MTDDPTLDDEALVTDVLLEVHKVTEVERAIYELNLRNARFLREQIDAAAKPTPTEIMLLFRHVLNFGFSQRALANWFGVTTGTLSRWVTGENPPRDFMRRAIVQQLGEVVDQVISRLQGYAKRPVFRSTPPVHRGKVVNLRK